MLSRSLLKTNSTVQDVLCTAVHGRRSLLPRSHTVLRYTKRRHFIQTRKKSTAFPARQHYVQICCAEFRYDRTANVQTADTTPLTSAKYGFHCTMQLAAVGRNFLYEVSTKSGQHTTTGRVWSTYAFNQTVPVPRSTERLLDFLKTLPASNFTKAWQPVSSLIRHCKRTWTLTKALFIYFAKNAYNVTRLPCARKTNQNT